MVVSSVASVNNELAVNLLLLICHTLCWSPGPGPSPGRSPVRIHVQIETMVKVEVLIEYLGPDPCQDQSQG